MKTLTTFTSEKTDFQLTADVQVSSSLLKVEFELQDKEQLFEKPAFAQNWSPDQIIRETGLWNHTCFEFFLNPVNSKKYYEFNFSLKPAWMVFQFESYRSPQPPASSYDFALQSMQWDAGKGRLTIELKNNSHYQKFNVGLTAVLEEKKSGAKHFVALTHKGTKADFHLLESFTLERG